MAFTQFGHFEIHQPIFDFIMHGKSGYIICDPHARKLYFEEGRLIYASSENEDDNYPRILVERGNLSETQYKEIQASLTKGESFGRKVREMGLVEPKELALALKLQVTRVVDSVALHKSGEYEVHEDELPQRMPRLKIQSLSLIGKSMLRIPGNELLPDLDPETNYRLHEDAEERAIELGVPKDLTEVFAFLKEHEWIQAEALQEFFDWDSDYLRKVLYFLIQLDIVEQDDSQDNILETEDNEIDQAALITAAGEADLLAEVLPETEPGTMDAKNAAPVYAEEEHHETDDDEFAIDHDTLPGKNVLKASEAEEQDSVNAAFEDEDITDYTLQEYSDNEDEDEAELSDPLEDEDEAELSDPLEDEDEAELSDPLEDEDEAELSDPLAAEDESIDTLGEDDAFVEEDDGPSYRGTFDEASFADLNSDEPSDSEPVDLPETSFADLNDDDLDATVHDPIDLGQPISDEFAPIDDFSGSVEPATNLDDLDDDSGLDTEFADELDDDEHDFSSLNQSIEEVTALDDEATEKDNPYDPDTDSLFPDELEEAPSPFETGPIDQAQAQQDDDIASELRSAISDPEDSDLEELDEDDLEEVPSPSDEDMWNNPTVTSRDELPDWSSYADQKEQEEAAQPEQPQEAVAQDFDPDDLVANKRPQDESDAWDAAAPSYGVDTNPMPVQDPIEHPPVDTVIMPDPVDEPESTTKKRSNAPLLLVLLLVIVAAAGFWFWQNSTQSTWEIEPEIATDTSDPSASTETVTTVDQPQSIPEAGTETIPEAGTETIRTTDEPTESAGTSTQIPASTTAQTETEAEQEPVAAEPVTPEPIAETATTPADTPSNSSNPVATTRPRPEPTTQPETVASDGYQSSMQQAVRTFQQEGARYSLTIVVACQSDTVDELMAKSYADKLHVFPRQLGERSCFMVTWGIFQTKEEAIAARAEMPDELRNRKDPAWVVDLDRYL